LQYYFVMTTITSVGYGDISASNNTEKVFVIGCQLTGGFVYALVIASLTAVVTFEETNDQ